MHMCSPSAMSPGPTHIGNFPSRIAVTTSTFSFYTTTISPAPPTTSTTTIVASSTIHDSVCCSRYPKDTQEVKHTAQTILPHFHRYRSIRQKTTTESLTTRGRPRPYQVHKRQKPAPFDSRNSPPQSAGTVSRTDRQAQRPLRSRHPRRPQQRPPAPPAQGWRGY